MKKQALLCNGKAVAVGLFLTILLAFTARATDAPLLSDAHISSAHPSTNFGSLTNLAVGNGNTALIQFNLGSLPAGTTSGGIAAATLRLYVNRVNTAGALDLKPVTAAWNELTVTFSSAPSFGAVVGSPIAVTQADTVILVDVTSLVQGWVTTPASNHGIALTASASAASTFVLLDSKENQETSVRRRSTLLCLGRRDRKARWARKDRKAQQARRVCKGQSAPLARRDRLVLRAQRERPAPWELRERKARRLHFEGHGLPRLPMR
jgi:hypothetical protein